MFTIVDTAIGALLLHQATTTLLFNNGTILGVSGLLRQLLNTRSLVSVLFFTGMALSYIVMNTLAPEVLPKYPLLRWDQGSILFTLLTSILVGWGTKVRLPNSEMQNDVLTVEKGCGGCTSGHMLCGLSRLSSRSLLATTLFFTAAATTFHLTNPSLDTSVCPSGVPCYHIATSLVLNSKPLYLLLSLSALAVEIIPSLLSTSTSDEAARRTTYLLTGYTFGLGLLTSGMASPAKVQAFFAVSLFPLNLEKWDPSLTIIILLGILPNMAHIQWRGLLNAPKFAVRFEIPTKTIMDVEWRFVGGAAAFGISWGVSGVCPGPAVLRAVGQPTWGILWFAGFWGGGMI